MRCVLETWHKGGRDKVQSVEDEIMRRVDTQIAWYGEKSITAQRWYKRLKLVSMVIAALIPFVSGLGIPYSSVIVGLMGVVITLCEGLQHLNQYQRNWLSYRTTQEALIREKFAYLSKAGIYHRTTEGIALLSERVEAIVQAEQTKWSTTQTSTLGVNPARA